MKGANTKDEPSKTNKLPFDFVDQKLVNERIEGVINKTLAHLQANGQMPERWEMAEYKRKRSSFINFSKIIF